MINKLSNERAYQYYDNLPNLIYFTFSNYSLTKMSLCLCLKLCLRQTRPLSPEDMAAMSKANVRAMPNSPLKYSVMSVPRSVARRNLVQNLQAGVENHSRPQAARLQLQPARAMGLVARNKNKAVTASLFISYSLLPEQRLLCFRVEELHLAGVEIQRGVFTHF